MKIYILHYYSYIMLSELQLLKLKILVSGIKITPKAKEKLSQKGKFPLSLFQSPTTSGITIVLQSSIYVNAQFCGKYINSEIDLDYLNEKFFIVMGEKRYEVDVLPLPDYINKTDSSNNLIIDMVTTYADRVRVAPIKGCSFNCNYCDLQLQPYKKYTLKNLLEALDISFQDQNLSPCHLLISGGTPRVEDRDYIDNIYEKITNFMRLKNIPVDIMLTPRPENNFLEKLKSYGVYGLSINLELFNEEYAKKYNPQKALISKKGYLDFIRKAVALFGKGRVRSLLIVGLESSKDTLKGVEEIAKLGCDVVLSPFVPSQKASLFNHPKPTVDELIFIYSKAKEIVDKYGVVLGPRCPACQHNTLSFP